MDLRIEKTKKAIRNAFIELRTKKPLEKITVKELCALACINKSTFYSHYEDIYALSEAMEQETVASIISGIDCGPGAHTGPGSGCAYPGGGSGEIR